MPSRKKILKIRSSSMCHIKTYRRTEGRTAGRTNATSFIYWAHFCRAGGLKTFAL